jgi:hypothetical protein
VPHEGPPHAFVIAESCSLRHFDHTADFPASQQPPRGFHAQRLDAACGCHSGAAGIGARERGLIPAFSASVSTLRSPVMFSMIQACSALSLNVRRLRREQGAELALAAGTFEKHQSLSSGRWRQQQ